MSRRPESSTLPGISTRKIRISLGDRRQPTISMTGSARGSVKTQRRARQTGRGYRSEKQGLPPPPDRDYRDEAERSNTTALRRYEETIWNILERSGSLWVGLMA